jgi:hypothetical protein
MGAKQMAVISQSAILSFLRRQESKVLDLTGFRIKVRNDSPKGSQRRNRE